MNFFHWCCPSRSAEGSPPLPSRQCTNHCRWVAQGPQRCDHAASSTNVLLLPRANSAGTGCSSRGNPQLTVRTKGGPVLSLPPADRHVHLWGKGSPLTFLNDQQWLAITVFHLWHFLCCSVITFYSTSVLSASRANKITNTFFQVKPSSTFSPTTRESHCPTVFRTSHSSQPWECWCHHKWSITTSQHNHSRAETLDLQP